MKYVSDSLKAAARAAGLVGVVGAGLLSSAHAAELIQIDGSSTVYPITEAVAEEFQAKSGGDIRVTVGISGTGGGFKRFCRGETDIRALLGAAGSIAYTGAGTSGRTYLDILRRLGLDRGLRDKSLPMGAGEPVAAVAAGDVVLAIAPLTTVLASPGVEPAAVFPDALGAHIDMSVFCRADPLPGATEVLDLLTGAGLDPDLSAAGLARFSLT